MNAHLRDDIMLEGKRCTWPEPTVISGRKVEPVQCANTSAKILRFISQCKCQKISKKSYQKPVK